MAARQKPKRPVETVYTAFEILEYLKTNNGGTLSAIADHLGSAKSTVHRHLSTLEHLEYVVRIDGEYYPSIQFLDFGKYAQNRHPGYGLAKEKVDQLADETEERAQFIVEEHGWGYYVHRATGAHAVRTDPGTGKRRHLHAAAAGKAILAYLPETRLDEIIDYPGLPPITPNTITDRDELLEELDRIRDRGYSTNIEENTNGLRAIGVPIREPEGSIIGAISVSGPTRRMEGTWFDKELPELLLGVANELELNIAYT